MTTLRRTSAAAVALAAFVLAAPGRAQDEPDLFIHGSFENQLTGMWLNLYEGGEALAVYDYTRLRIDVDAELPGGLELRSDVVGRLFVGQTDLQLADLIPRRTLDALIAADPRWSSVLEDSYALENELYIDNAYLKVPVKDALVTVGKQPLEQGAGYAWNPTDPFTTKELFDPTYEKPGVIAARLLVPLGDLASIDLVGAPDGRFAEWAYGGRAAVRLGPLSLSAAGYVSRARRTDLEGSMDAMMEKALGGGDPEDGVIEVEARRTLVGGDAVLDVAGVRLWAEGAYNFVENKPGGPRDWWELVGGAEYYFESETHVMVEYLHYGRGPVPEGGAYGFNAWMGALDQELRMLGRDFLLAAIDQPLADFWTVGLTAIESFSDTSAVVMGDLRWEFVQDAELWLMLAATAGEREDFFSASRGQGWLRLKVYF